ncbi:hypothetical protein [Streptomyces griseoluteus]|uniref:hypothetical protein n=1 Tax=Streptomyces griseoluteus TaxID=29306 RepID=UPI003438C28A
MGESALDNPASAQAGAVLVPRRATIGKRLAAGDPWDEPEYEHYPPTLKSPLP